MRFIVGCASKSSEVAPLSPVMYQNYTCQQITVEAQNVVAHAAQMAGARDDKRTKDQIATSVANVVFWPAAFFVGGDGNTAAELGRLKRQMQALEPASVMKNCGIKFQQAPPPA
jgi:hypothetical protein